MPATVIVTVEDGGSGSDLDCFSDASLEPPFIVVYNPDVLGVYLVRITADPCVSAFCTH